MPLTAATAMAGHRPEGDEAGEHRDERQGDVADPRQLDLAQVRERRQDHERDEVEGEGRRLVQPGGDRDGGRRQRRRGLRRAETAVRFRTAVSS